MRASISAVLLFGAAACAPALKPITGATPVAPPAGDAVALPASSAVSLSDADYLRWRSLMVPVDGISPERIPDSFDAPRDGGERTHHALDILAPRGTPVLATDDGRVLRVSRNNLGGLTVYVLDLAERFVYYYAHLDHYRDGLVTGMPLARGDVLGYVGTTGNAPENVPHLHFQMMRYQRSRYWEGEPVDPKPYLVGVGRATVISTASTREQTPQP